MGKTDIYEKLKAETEEDILLHFPRRYDDLSKVTSEGNFKDGQKVLFKGNYSNLISIQGGKIIRMVIHPSGASFEATGVLFGQPFYVRVLKKDKTYYFWGTYRSKQKAVMLSQIISVESNLVRNPFKPYYSLPHDVSQSRFYDLVLSLLTYKGDYINEVIPSFYRQKYKLEERFKAFKDVHIPLSLERIEAGLRVFKYEEALNYCLYTLYQKKLNSEVKKKEMALIDRAKLNRMVSLLPYKLTEDQKQAVVEIVLDMDKPAVMHRLLEGDVGTGKTIVAFLALYANYLRGGQGVLLAPTLTLARQHFSKAKKIFASTPVRIVLYDASLSAKEKEEAAKKIASGETDYIIGTHSVFSDSLVYNNLTLAIEDEQHKFGVAQREKLIQKGEGVDTLMMSATPIPRTLSQIINSDLDISILTQFPSAQREVTTKVVSSGDPLIKKAIMRALELHKQVFIVAPKIEKSEKSARLSSKAVFEMVKEEYGEDNCALLTGNIKKPQQEAIYNDFITGKKLILVSTSLIEVGIDVKNAVLMIVYEANYFGLASLHQLRGRIGRNGEGAMALLVYDGEDEEALDKLNYLASHPKGEDIALYDLSHRGSGDLLGERQAGQSNLQVADFVTDYKVFECAKKDGEEILAHLSIKENASYLDRLIKTYKKEEEEDSLF
jgi:ATP-dependent DNA helicase RecG